MNRKSKILNDVIHSKVTIEESWKSLMKHRFSSVEKKLFEYEKTTQGQTKSQWLLKSEYIQ